MEIETRILKNQYHDSVALMLASRTLRESEGVADAAFIMGTDANKELLKQGGLLTKEAETARANDLIITIKCDADATHLLDKAEKLLKERAAKTGEVSYTARTMRAALLEDPLLNLAVISVAGAYAAREAREALAGGLHVLLFSDNVSLDDEIALKKLALERGLLLMGPGAGTAIINGVGLGFANAVPRGKIGIVSAAGTGLQEVSTLAAKHGAGISQAIGTGGRDLSESVGGLTFFAAVDALMADPATEVLALVSKPPDREVKGRLLDKLRGTKKKVVLCLLGAETQDEAIENLVFTRTLEECAFAAADVQSDASREDLAPLIADWKGRFSEKQRFIRGLFSGGTLCYEAQVIWQDALKDPVLSNAPVDKKNRMPDSMRSSGHSAVDLGEEEFTVGRPHPMIDNELLIRRMKEEAKDPAVAVIMLDVVIGYGAHENPAAELGEAVQEIWKELKLSLIHI